MTKLFASDFDGTLHFWGRPGPLISDSDREAIEEFQREGGLFGICTGRALASLLSQTEGQIDFDFYITVSGAALFDAHRKLLWQRTIEREKCREMCEHYESRFAPGVHKIVVAADDYWAVGSTVPRFPLPHVDTFDEIPGPFYGFSIAALSVDAATAYAADINERYCDIVVAHQNEDSVDIVPVGCTKGTGLRIVAKRYDATLTAGMGDSFNDLPLLEAADVAYTFNSSAPDVRAAADVLADHASEAIRDFMTR